MTYVFNAVKPILTSFLFLSTAIAFSPVKAGEPADSVYLDAGDSTTALVLAHGRGKHPKWLVVDPLRKAVHKTLNYHTLSLQMPNEDKVWLKYADDFPEAYSIIQSGIEFLTKEKGVTRIYLLGHSMGGRMTSAFVSENPEQSLAGLIVAGCRNNGTPPLSCKQNLENVSIPVLDIWGSKNKKDVNAADERKELVSESYQQISIAGANHKFSGFEKELNDAVISWLKSQP